jgi:Tfp pilus tip-associated adhesin PilY1
MFHPERHGLIVCFGTGKYLGDSDFGDMSLQSVYGIWDYGDRIYTQKTRTWSQDDDDEYLGAFIGRTSAPYLSHQPETVKLLQQVRRDHALTIEGNDMLVRVLSADKPSWETIPDPDNAYLQKPDPSNSKVNEAGYYFDLSAGERIISDVSIRDAKLIVIGFTPNADPCGPGGRSMFMEINAFTGGNPGSALLDINRDRKVDSRDLVRVDFDSDGVPEEMPPAGLEFVGNLQPPAILGFGGGGDVENKYMSSSTGTIEILRERPPKLGVTYWMEIRY